MLKDKDILDESDNKLRLISKPVSFPLSKKDVLLINNMINYLISNYSSSKTVDKELLPGIAMSAIQVGVPKRYFVVVDSKGNGIFEKYILINPQIIKSSVEKIYAKDGEGCLSIKYPKKGIALRHKSVIIEAFDIYGNQFRIKAKKS